jgi:hypothetical protein
MKQKKNVLPFILINLLIVLACNAGTPSPRPDEPPQEQPSPVPPSAVPSSSGLCENALMPVRHGASWTYINSGGPDGTFTYTDTITDIHADGFTLTTQFPGLVRTQEWSCEADGLKALQLGGGPAASISAQDLTATFKTLEVSGVSYPKTITPGMTWQYTLTMEGTTAMPGDMNAPSEGAFTATMQEAGRETVTVPAGTFEALKFQYTNMVRITADFQGIKIPLEFSGSGFAWFAPGVGFIKSIENSNLGDAPSTYTTELQAYVIP